MMTLMCFHTLKNLPKFPLKKGKSYVSQNILFVQMSSILFTILQNGLGEAVLMSTRNILFTGEFMKLALIYHLLLSFSVLLTAADPVIMAKC